MLTTVPDEVKEDKFTEGTCIAERNKLKGLMGRNLEKNIHTFSNFPGFILPTDLELTSTRLGSPSSYCRRQHVLLQ